MELQYEKAMKEYGLSYNDLPEDAQTGIDGIKDVLKGINMLERKGKKVTQKTLKKLKAMDKWVYYEILDHVNNTDDNDEEMPEDPGKVVSEMNEEITDISDADKKGYEIEAELKSMFDSGKKEWSIEEIKGSAKKTYAILFDTYEDEEENGIKTSNYSLIEKDNKIFVISQN